MRLLTLAIALLAFASPGFAADPPKPLTVFAAASLKGPLDEAAAAFTAAGGLPVTVSYAGSPALAKQIEQGDPADVFVSADKDWIDYTEDRNLTLSETRRDLFGNALVLIAPADAETDIAITPGFDLAGALGERRLAVADPDAVPAGRYAKAALTALGVWDKVEPKLIRAENVRLALAYVAKNEAPFGIVYLTDQMAEPKVRLIGVFPADTHPKIVYPGAIVASSAQSEAATRFLDFLSSDEGFAIFARAGFTKP
jgi:molybdate transport system substrate-binding protein